MPTMCFYVDGKYNAMFVIYANYNGNGYPVDNAPSLKQYASCIVLKNTAATPQALRGRLFTNHVTPLGLSDLLAR